MFRVSKALKEEKDDIFPLSITCPACGVDIVGSFFAKQHFMTCLARPQGAVSEEEKKTNTDNTESIKKLNDILKDKIV